MKIISSDGIGVRALLAAAEKLYELTEERGIGLGVIQDGGETYAVAYADPIGLGVTIERNPRIIDLGVAPRPEPEHDLGPSGTHLVDGSCICTSAEGCCNSPEGACICPDCTDECHGH